MDKIKIVKKAKGGKDLYINGSLIRNVSGYSINDVVIGGRSCTSANIQVELVDVEIVNEGDVEQVTVNLQVNDEDVAKQVVSSINKLQGELGRTLLKV